MSPPVDLNLILSFVVGALSVTGLTLTVDYCGSRVAGALGGFPATLAASLFFSANSSSVETAARTAEAVPALMSSYGLFLVVFAALISRSVSAALIGATILWGLGAAFAIHKQPGLAGSIATLTLAAPLCALVFERHLKIHSRSGARAKFTVLQSLFRMAVGGSLVAGSVYLGTLGNEVQSAVCATFPAVTVGALLVTYANGGADLSRAVAKAMAMSGMVNVSAYAVAVAALYPRAGLLLGTAGSMAIAVATSFMTYQFMRRYTS